MQLKTKTKESWVKTLEKKLKTLADQFPEINAIYKANISSRVDLFVEGDFPDREREDAFYKEEGEILAWSPPGKLLMILINRCNYEQPANFSPPDGSAVLFKRDS
jgi:hypothetical protein